MIGRIFLTAAALLLPAAASAQDAAKPIEEAAADLAYGFCPLFLAGQFPLTGNPQLTALGFGDTVEKQANARFGELQVVSARRADGELSFGGAPEKTCSVVVAGDKRDAALKMLHTNMEYMGLDFKPATDAKVPTVPGVTVETFKAPVEGQFLYVQLIQAGGATPIVSAQLFAMDQ